MPRVKLCGTTTAADRDAAVAAGADAVGFIVDVPVDTHRELAPETARDLVAGLPPFVTSVLVTMPESVEDVLSLQRTVRADTIQVHGTLAPAQVGGLRARADATVLTAVSPDDDIDAYADSADGVLVDTIGTDGGGGTGETHDWERTRDIVASIDVPVILAGGLTPENVGKAVERVDPYAVDTASGVEADDGTKDHAAMRRFVHAATENPRSIDA
jgi:phosphoribosylanthranilate isomerase